MDNLLRSIPPIIQQMQELMAIHAPVLQGQVNAILEQRSKDIDRIDHLMDDLLVVIPHGYCLEDFERLNNYLKTLDAEAAAYYAEQLKEYALHPIVNAKTATGYGYFNPTT
jgi:Tfp pilus assembly protein PilN